MAFRTRDARLDQCEQDSPMQPEELAKDNSIQLFTWRTANRARILLSGEPGKSQSLFFVSMLASKGCPAAETLFTFRPPTLRHLSKELALRARHNQRARAPSAEYD